MSDKPRKRLTSDQKRIKELENQISILQFKLKQNEIDKLPPVTEWAMDVANKALVEKLRTQTDEERIKLLKNWFGEMVIDDSQNNQEEQDNG